MDASRRARRPHRKIRVGVLVSSNTFRHPALLAKEAVTVDHISNGRLEVGDRRGLVRPRASGLRSRIPTRPELVGRFREAIDVVDSLLRNDMTTYEGKYYQLAEAPMRPRPIQQPRPPLTLGAHGPKMLRIVAEYADTWNSFGTIEQMRQRGADSRRAVHGYRTRSRHPAPFALRVGQHDGDRSLGIGSGV